MGFDPEARRWTQADVVATVPGVAPVLQSWLARGYLRLPGVHAEPGKGKHRRWNALEVVLVAVIYHLTRVGVPVGAAVKWSPQIIDRARQLVRMSKEELRVAKDDEPAIGFIYFDADAGLVFEQIYGAVFDLAPRASMPGEEAFTIVQIDLLIDRVFSRLTKRAKAQDESL